MRNAIYILSILFRFSYGETTPITIRLVPSGLHVYFAYEVWKVGSVIFSFTRLIWGLLIAGIKPFKVWEHGKSCQITEEGLRSDIHCGHDGHVFKIRTCSFYSFYSQCHDGPISWSIKLSVDLFFSAQIEWQYVLCIPTVNLISKFLTVPQPGRSIE